MSKIITFADELYTKRDTTQKNLDNLEKTLHEHLEGKPDADTTLLLEIDISKAATQLAQVEHKINFYRENLKNT